MAWNDAPPTPDELKASDWSATPPSPEELKAASEPQWKDLPKNALQGIKEAPETAINMAKMPMNMAEGALKTAGGLAIGQPFMETPAGHVAGSIGNDVASFVKHPIDTTKRALIEHPIQSALMAASFAAPELAEMNEVSPAMDTMGEYAKRFGQNQTMKTLGASSGQIGQAGVKESRAIAQDLLDKGVISPLRGPIGLEEKVNDLSTKAGGDIGAARKAADLKGTAPQMPEILQQVKQNLEGKYGSGTHKGEMVGLNKAREEIAKGGTGTFTGNAQKATDINSFAAQNKIYRPQTAATDVADTISGMNNSAIQKALTPQEFSQYQAALKDYGNLNKVKQFLERGERREMGGRMGSSLMKTAADKTMDAMGNRIAATSGNLVGNVLQSPLMAKYLPTLVKAAAKGEGALATTHALLSKYDPEYAAETNK